MKKVTPSVIENIEIPDDCSRIVLTQKNSKIVIRNANVATSSIESKHALLMQKLVTFFEVPEHFEAFAPFLTQETDLSLRLLDWLVTNYSKKEVIMLSCVRGGTKETINLFLDYKAHLKSYSKRSFDPFCRRERIIVTFGCDDEKRKFITTSAQMNFFRWAISTGVLAYCREHLDEIEADMVSNMRIRISPGTRRCEISRSATSALVRSQVNGSIGIS
jgi:hypothetical protein